MDLLLRLLVGVAVGGLVGAAGYGVYKLITSDSLKEDVKDDLREQDEDLLQKAFKEYNLLTAKPTIYAANVAEDDMADDGASNKFVQSVFRESLL